jgi:hypothetical protein
VQGRLQYWWGLKSEVGRIVAEEHAKQPWTVFAHTTPHDDTRQCDRHSVLTLQSEEPWTVPLSVIARQVTGLEAVYPDRHGVRVVRVVSFGNQHGAHGHARAVLGITPATS